MKLLITFLCSIIFFSAQAFADDLENSRVELAAKKKIMISKSMKLNKNETEAFWKVYADYEKDLSSVAKDGFKLIRKYSNQYKNKSITEQSAANMLSESFRLNARELQIKQSYLPRFQEILPNKKVVRFYQIDNKIDSLIGCDIAKKLPLIAPDMEF